MSKVTINYLFLSFVILLFGTAGGSLMTRKMAGGAAGWSFFSFALPFCAAIFACQCLVFPKARARLLYQLLFLGLLGLTMTWFMLSIILPVFWISPMAAMPKAVLAVVFAAILAYNLVFGWRTLNQRWPGLGLPAFEQQFKPRDGTVDWDHVMRDMRIAPAIILPGVPDRWSAAVWIAIVAGVISGLVMKSAWPTFSAFSWSIPAILVTACINQFSGAYFAQAIKVRQLERDRKIVLKAWSRF